MKMNQQKDKKIGTSTTIMQCLLLHKIVFKSAFFWADMAFYMSDFDDFDEFDHDQIS